MKAVLAYVRNLLTFYEENPNNRENFKRVRENDDLSLDEDPLTLRRAKRLKETAFPDTMETRDVWGKEDSNKKVRYVPIQIEKAYPSTSTPKEVYTGLHRRKTLPTVKLLDVAENGQSSPILKTRTSKPSRPVVHAVIDDDDDEEVTLVESKPESSKKSKIFVDLDDNDDDVIFVKKVAPPPTAKPYKFFISKNIETEDSQDEEPQQYYRLCRKSFDRSHRTYSSLSPKSTSKFKEPPGITKSYRKVPTTIPRWLQPTQKTSGLLPNKNILQNVNGSVRSTLLDVFNLDQKRSYQALIKRVAESMSASSARKPDILSIAEDAAVLRNTQRAQQSSLNEIRLVEKGIGLNKENESATEYDPITVASLNSSDSEVEKVPSEASTSSSTRIGRINTLRDSYRDISVTSNDWLSNVHSKYKKRSQDNQVKLIDAARESDIISKVNHKQNIALLEHKLKYELSIPESLIVEAEPSLELPKLSPEQAMLVDKALGPGPPGQLLVEKFNLRIHRRDLQTLAGLNWLNDEVINFYMNLLMQRSEERKDLPRVYATNTFFYPKLMQSGQAGLKRWTRKVDIFAHELMVVPVHLGVHWCVSLVQFAEKRVLYLDSMGGRNQRCLDALLQYLRDEHADKKGRPFDDSGWTTESLKDIPQQMNGSDCGMFACTFAEFAARRARFAFTQAHMPALRRKAAYEILSGKLML